MAFDLNGNAKTYIRSSNSGTTAIQARVGKVAAKTATISFVNAPAEKITVELGTATLPALYGSSVAITSRLERSVGIVTSGQSVLMEDSVAGGIKIGTWLSQSSSNNLGQVNSSYGIQDTTFRGYLYVKCTYSTSAGVKVIGRNRILIHK